MAGFEEAADGAVKVELSDYELTALREGWMPISAEAEPTPQTMKQVYEGTIQTMQSRILWLIAQQSDFVAEINMLRQQLAALRNQKQDDGDTSG